MEATELEGAGLFSALSAEDRQRFSDVMHVESHRRGTVLVEEGDIPSKFFVLLAGSVTVHREGRHLTDLGPGDYFGEIGVLSLGPRNASVIATTPVQAAVAMGWDLRRLLEEHPALGEELARMAGSRADSAG